MANCKSCGKSIGFSQVQRLAASVAARSAEIVLRLQMEPNMSILSYI